MRCLFVLVLLFTVAAQAAEIRGKVTSTVGGESLGRVQVVIVENKLATVTSLAGEFTIPDLVPGNYTLRLDAVGYRMLTIPFTLASAVDSREFSITMVPDNFHHTDKVEVHGDVFHISDSPAIMETNLTASEIRQTSTVFADDPFRAVQSLPGVSAEGNNEFFAEFSVMGAPFSDVSIYIDDVLVPSPFHEIGNFAEGASLGVLTSEVVEEMKLFPAAYPEKFGDAAGAALDIRTREGSRRPPLFRLSAGIAASEFLGEGALGPSRRGSWLVSARRSYINYLLHHLAQDAAEVGFYDGDVKLSYDLTPRQNVNFFSTAGHTVMHVPGASGNNTFASGASDFMVARVGWRFSANPHLLLDAHAAFFREPDELRNPDGTILETSDQREWVEGAGVTWNWASQHVLEAGWTLRRIHGSESQGGFDSQTGEFRSATYYGNAWHNSGYLQQQSSFWKNGLHLLGGVRWDSLQKVDLHPFSPQISLALQATPSTELQLGAAMYRQFPSLAEYSNFCTQIADLPRKANHYTAAIDQRLNANTRVRLEVFERQDTFLFGIIPGQTLSAVPAPCGHALEPAPGYTYERQYSRGAQLVIQRRSANRLSGWLGYTLAQAQQRQYEITFPFFPFPLFQNTTYYPTLEDQRHALNLFAMYRLRPTLNLSGKFLYGSGFPVSTGEFVLVGTTYQQVGTSTMRFPYLRLDARCDKDWVFDRWKLTLYGELLNVTNHYNSRFFYSSVIINGQSQVKTLQGLPLTPTAGLAFQF